MFSRVIIILCISFDPPSSISQDRKLCCPSLSLSLSLYYIYIYMCLSVSVNAADRQYVLQAIKHEEVFRYEGIMDEFIIF